MLNKIKEFYSGDYKIPKIIVTILIAIFIVAFISS